MGRLKRLLFLMTVLFLLSWLMVSTPALAEKVITVSGKIVAITLEPLALKKGVLVISNFRGKETTDYVGFKTQYIPRRPPAVGDRVEIECLRVQGRLAATTVRFKKEAKAI